MMRVGDPEMVRKSAGSLALDDNCVIISQA